MYRHLFPFLLFESSNLSTILKQLTVQISTVLTAREPVLRTRKCETPHACRGGAPGNARWNFRDSRQRRFCFRLCKLFPAALTLQIPTSRGLPNAIDNVRHRAFMRGGVPRFGGKDDGFQRKKENSPKGLSFFLWCAFGDFRHKTKVTARRGGET